MKGRLKEIAGKLTDNPKLKAAGTYEKMSGIVQEKIGQVQKVFGKQRERRIMHRRFLAHRLALHDTPQPGLRKE